MTLASHTKDARRRIDDDTTVEEDIVIEALKVGTAAGVVALASVGVGVGTLNDWSRHKSAVFNHRASRSALVRQSSRR